MKAGGQPSPPLLDRVAAQPPGMGPEAPGPPLGPDCGATEDGAFATVSSMLSPPSHFCSLVFLRLSDISVCPDTAASSCPLQVETCLLLGLLVMVLRVRVARILPPKPLMRVILPHLFISCSAWFLEPLENKWLTLRFFTIKSSSY